MGFVFFFLLTVLAGRLLGHAIVITVTVIAFIIFSDLFFPLSMFFLGTVLFVYALPTIINLAPQFFHFLWWLVCLVFPYITGLFLLCVVFVLCHVAKDVLSD
jgi:hypothetical protein